jgi:hypothetical protein
MTATDVGNLTAANMIATNGFDTNTPFLQPVVYLRTTDISSAPSISGITISYITGTGAIVVWANHFTSDVPVNGGSDIPQGTYIWDLNGGFRLEDGATDNNNAIEYEYELQDFIDGGDMKSIFHAIEFDYESAQAGQTFTVTPISDDEALSSKTVTTQLGRHTVRAGVIKSDAGLTHRVRVAWTGNNLTFHRVGIIYETSGSTKK